MKSADCWFAPLGAYLPASSTAFNSSSLICWGLKVRTLRLLSRLFMVSFMVLSASLNPWQVLLILPRCTAARRERRLLRRSCPIPRGAAKPCWRSAVDESGCLAGDAGAQQLAGSRDPVAVSYTHLRAHETRHD